MFEQFFCLARIFGRDAAHFAQDAQRAVADIIQIPDRGGDKV